MFSWFHTPYFGTVYLNNLYLDLFAQPSLYKVELKSSFEDSYWEQERQFKEIKRKNL